MTENRLELQNSLKLSQSLQTAIRLLSLDLDDLSGEMTKAVAENPALEYVPPRKSAQDYAVQFRARYGSARGTGEGPRDIPDESATLRSDLEQQLRLGGYPEDVLQAALCILHELTPRGYFAQSLRDFADENAIPLDTARRALDAVQALEPAGVGARTVAESLELQLRERPDADPLCRDLIRFYLLEIGKGQLQQIARETGASPAHIRACVDCIRSLNPFPCSLQEESIRYITPEFSVEQAPDGQLTILFHNEYFPTLRKDETFVRLAATLTEEEQAFARKALAAANRLLHAIDMRQTTMEKLARIIVREQHAYFAGLSQLAPLRIDEVAREIGVHESTVYRAIQNKYLYCARGTLPLSRFFQRELAGGTSAAAVRDMIARLCREGGKLSDREIAERLEQQGVRLSRRTVAKYRAQMDIDSSFHRPAGTAGGAS